MGRVSAAGVALIVRRGQVIVPNFGRQLDVGALRVGQHERAVALIGLGVGVELNDVGARLRRRASPKQAVGLARHRIGRRLVGERKLVHRVHVVFVLPGETAWLREPVVHEGLAPSADNRVHALEHPAPGGVFVEALVDEVALHAAALRRARGDGDGDHRLAVHEQRVVVARLVGRVAAKEAHDIADSGEAHARDNRVLGLIHELVDRTGVGSGRLLDLDRRVIDVGPLGRRHRSARIRLVDAHRHRGLALVQRCRGIGQLADGIGRSVANPFLPCRSDDRLSVFRGDRQTGLQKRRIRAARGRGHADALPAARDEGVAVAHDERVTHVGRLVAESAFVEIAVHESVPTIVELVEKDPVPFVHVHGLEDLHVEGVLDHP